jgi:hypothetical protein
MKIEETVPTTIPITNASENPRNTEPLKRNIELAPEQKDIHAAVRRAVVTQWFADASGWWFPVPRLHPRADTLLQVADDALGNLGVNVLASYAVGVPNVSVGHFPVSLNGLYEVLCSRTYTSAHRRGRG